MECAMRCTTLVRTVLAAPRKRDYREPMTDDSRFVEALLAAATAALFFGAVLVGGYRVVTWARRQSKGAYVIGAALAPFIGMGNVVDPDFRIVQEAKQLKKREEDDPGDPSNPAEEGIG